MKKKKKKKPKQEHYFFEEDIRIYIYIYVLTSNLLTGLACTFVLAHNQIIDMV
jgi:hypothetical protein